MINPTRSFAFCFLVLGLLGLCALAAFLHADRNSRIRLVAGWCRCCARSLMPSVRSEHVCGSKAWQVETVVAEKRAVIYSMAALALATATDATSSQDHPEERSRLRKRISALITTNVFGRWH